MPNAEVRVESLSFKRSRHAGAFDLYHEMAGETHMQQPFAARIIDYHDLAGEAAIDVAAAGLNSMLRPSAERERFARLFTDPAMEGSVQGRSIAARQLHTYARRIRARHAHVHQVRLRRTGEARDEAIARRAIPAASRSVPRGP